MIDEVDRVAQILMREWGIANDEPVHPALVETFRKMAQAVIDDRESDQP